MNTREVSENKFIVSAIESAGGACVWEPEIFTVTLIDVSVGNALAESLSRLRGVHQIALNCKNIDFPCLLEIARIPGLQSLVVSELNIEKLEYEQLFSVGPIVEIVENA